MQQQQIRLNIGTQTKTESSYLPEIISKTPRMILRNLQSTKMRSQLYINTDTINKPKYLSRQTSIQKLDLDACKQKINQMSNDDNRLSLQNLKKWNKEQITKRVCQYIRQNNIKHNIFLTKLSQYEKQAPFILDQYKFIEKVLPEKQRIQKLLGIPDENLQKNKLILEKIILERLL